MPTIGSEYPFEFFNSKKVGMIFRAVSSQAHKGFEVESELTQVCCYCWICVSYVLPKFYYMFLQSIYISLQKMASYRLPVSVSICFNMEYWISPVTLIGKKKKKMVWRKVVTAHLARGNAFVPEIAWNLNCFQHIKFPNLPVGNHKKLQAKVHVFS